MALSLGLEQKVPDEMRNNVPCAASLHHSVFKFLQPPPRQLISILVRDEFVIIKDSAIRPCVETVGLSFQSETRGMIEAEVARLKNQARFISEKIEGKIAIGMHLCFYFWCKGSFLRGAHEKILLKETAFNMTLPCNLTRTDAICLLQEK